MAVMCLQVLARGASNQASTKGGQLLTNVSSPLCLVECGGVQ
jgi:hypothetical protein